MLQYFEGKYSVKASKENSNNFAKWVGTLKKKNE